MCKKKQLKYRPKKLSEEEQKYIDAQFRREIIMAIIAIVAGIAIAAALLAITRQVVSL